MPGEDNMWCPLVSAAHHNYIGQRLLKPFWLKPFLFKAILLTRVDLFVLDLFVFCFSSRQLDSIQDAVWKTILRGRRPPSVRWEKERNQSAVANPKTELKWKDTVAKRQGNASQPKVVLSQPQRSLR